MFYWEVRSISGIAPLLETPDIQGVGRLSAGFVFENEEVEFFYKVKNSFVHKIITPYFFCFVSLDFCILGLVKASTPMVKTKANCFVPQYF